MAKTQATTTLSPIVLSLGQLIRGQDFRTIARLLNWLFGYRRQTHFALTVAHDGWGSSGNEVGTIRLVVANTSVVEIDTDVWLDPDEARAGMTFGACCSVVAANTITVACRLTGSLGTATVTLTFVAGVYVNDADATANFSAGTIAGVTAGGEWVRVEILTQRTAGASNANRVTEVRLESDLVTSSLPDPTND